MKEKLKIIQAIQGMSKGGAERYAADVSIALQSLGHQVKLVNFGTSNAYPFLTDQLDYETCNSFVQPSISGKSKIHIKDWENIIADFEPDIIHTHLFKAEMTAKYKIHPGVTYVSTCQNNMPEFQELKLSKTLSKLTWTRQYEKQWMIKKYRECENNFIAISKNTLSYYQNSLPSDLAKRISLIYHAINFEKFNRVNRSRVGSLHQIKMVYTARYATYKNHIFLIDVVDYLKNLSKKVSLVLLGEGPEMDSVKKRAKDLRVENEVQILGNVDNVEEYLRDANVYVHPATYEPFGLVIIEAMAAGLPAICLDGKGNRDLIENGKNGYMIMEENATAFAEKIIEVVENPEAYQALSDQAVEFAEQFDINVHASKLNDYYLSCIREESVTV